MITIEQLLDRVKAEVDEKWQDDPLGFAAVDDCVRSAVKNLGLCVHATTGEVYDPAPRPVMNYPEQNGARQPRMRRRR